MCFDSGVRLFTGNSQSGRRFRGSSTPPAPGISTSLRVSPPPPPRVPLFFGEYFPLFDWFLFAVELATQLDEGGKGLARTVADVKDANKRTALHFAAREGRTEVCKYLVEELGLDVDVRDEDGTLLKTPVFLVSEHWVCFLHLRLCGCSGNRLRNGSSFISCACPVFRPSRNLMRTVRAV